MVLILNKLWITKIVTTAWHLQIKSQVFITNKVIEAIPPERTSPRYKTVRKKTLQFDAENSLISFYTENSEILEVKEKRKNKSSSIGTVLIIILIILVVLGLIFGAYWFFIKRRRSVETNINTFSKFDDEDSYNNLNGKKVFELY